MKRYCSLLALLFSTTAFAQRVVDSTLIYHEAPFPSCHAATIAETKDGDLVTAFFGGSWEGCKDVCIWSCRKDKGSKEWTAPIVIAKGDVGDTIQHPSWNPVLFQVPIRHGALMLWYKTGIYIKDWVAHQTISFDGGYTWGPALPLSYGSPDDHEYWRLGPIKNKPIYHNGRIIAPSSWENGNIWHTQFEYCDFDGRHGFNWKISHPETPDSIRSIQPTILVHKDGTLQALCRTKEGFLSTTYSHDNGKSWTPETLTDIPHNNSGIDAVTLKDGRFAMVYNPVGLNPGSEFGNRYPLVLAFSTDGLHWQTVLTLEEGPGEFSYPSIIQGKKDDLHIVYTYNRKRIKYVRVKL